MREANPVPPMVPSSESAHDAPLRASVVVRDGTPADWPLMCSAFAQVYSGTQTYNRATAGYRAKSYYGHRVPPQLLVQKLDNLYQHPAWKFIVACPGDNSDEIMGLLLYNKRTHAVGWITVKPIYQRMGVARALFGVAGIVPGQVECAFLLPDIAKWAREIGYVLRFRPYLPDVALWETLDGIAR